MNNFWNSQIFGVIIGGGFALLGLFISNLFEMKRFNKYSNFEFKKYIWKNQHDQLSKLKGLVGYCAYRLKGRRDILSYREELYNKLNEIESLYGYFTDYSILERSVNDFVGAARLLLSAAEQNNLKILSEQVYFDMISHNSDDIFDQCNQIIQSGTLPKLYVYKPSHIHPIKRIWKKIIKSRKK